ncbi:APC family permease [Spelaeicoccus albus]|uniref:Putrescine importer n=1 Tax=Spelaeicoccus albus TaxID=1280376 RepID=A0A7Z0D4D0_9MICO|nr:APC family permease [Spelaeicoccus albus]NYI68633.1 putrescine importer [Spelaeicoccus albus]
MPGDEGQLKRRLKLRHVVFIGLAYMSPFAVFDTFGIVSRSTDGHVPASYIIVTIAILFTAFSYGKMVKLFPVAGSAYTYTRRTIGSGLGFLVGWAALLDYLFLPMINALLAKIYLSAEFPSVPGWAWIVGLLVVITVLNIVGVKITATANVLMVLYQLVIAIVFVVLTIRVITADNAAQFSLGPFYSMDMQTGSLFAGASVLALAFLGFDAVTTLAEETIEPKKNMPKAIFLIALLGAGFFTAVTYFMQTLFPDVSALSAITHDIAAASPHIALYIGGIVFQTIFLSGAFISVLSSGLASQTSASRLLYAMGRDGILFKKFFGYIQPRFGTPLLNIVVIGIVALTALFLDLNTATSLINFGAFTAFAFVNLSVVAYYLRQHGFRIVRSAVGWLIVPLIGFIINVYLWYSLDMVAMIVGLSWTAIGFLYLLYITKFFTAPAPQVAFEEAE